MAPALVPALIGQEAAACALLGLVLGSVRAVFPVRGRAAGPLRLARRALQPLAAARKNRAEQARARRAQKRSAKKPKKNLPSTRRLLYNSNVSK